jgi:hypothetical protein
MVPLAQALTQNAAICAAKASPATCNAHKAHESGGSASHRHPAAGVSGVEQRLQRPVERRVAGIGPERGHDVSLEGERSKRPQPPTDPP